MGHQMTFSGRIYR